MRTRTQSALTYTTILAVLALTSAATAGPLNPPAGPVGPTSKPLTEVEPRTAINAANTPGDDDSLYRITQPGSYYLTANLIGQPGKSGIEIATGNVTLDLNGFTLDGRGDAATLSGITFSALGTHANIVVRNGAVVGWGNSGIIMSMTGVVGKRVERIVARANAGGGINIGSDATLTDCSAFNNAGYGMLASSNSLLTNCIAAGNTNVGIGAGSACTVTSCTAHDNGAYGIEAGDGSAISRCTSSSNDWDGFSIGSRCSVANCASTENTQDGMALGSGCSVTAVAASANGIYGIYAGAGCTIADSTAESNGATGIAFNSASIIRGNTCRANGTALGGSSGLWSNGSNSRVEGNTCTGAAYGIRLITGSRNVIIGNQCSGASIENWRFAANNIYGPIIDRSAVATAVVGGNTAASTIGTTDPHANFTN